MQQWIGDLVDVGPGKFAGNRINVPMSTAIFRAYSAEGFVIAADGRVCGVEDMKHVTNEAQKIFPIGESGLEFLACSISGTASIPAGDASKMAFEFVPEINSASQALPIQKCRTLTEYARRAYSVVHQRLKAAKRAGLLNYPESETLDSSERGSTIVRVLIDGYCRGLPSRVKVRFYHEHQTLAPLEVLAQELAVETAWYQGPESVFELLFRAQQGASNRWLSAYNEESMKLIFHPNETLDKHARMAHVYIKASSGPEALALDPKRCAGIGGHIHIATITPKDGFQWVIRPIDGEGSRKE